MGTRYIARGTEKIMLIPAVASPATGPSVAEIAAGTDITDFIRDVNGFTYTATTIEGPDMGSVQNKKFPGIDDAPDSSFVVYNENPTNGHEAILARGVSGYIAFFSTGAKVAGSKLDLFHAAITGNNKGHTSGAELSTSRVGVAVGDAWQNIAVKA
jgi:hypothetical protein